nr:MAG TPA_asm: hypothetical protein [Caudoviricetes sp.]
MLRFCDFPFFNRAYVVFSQICTNNVRSVDLFFPFSTPLMLKIKVPVIFAHAPSRRQTKYHRDFFHPVTSF